MTALTLPVRPEHRGAMRPVPWRRMAWVTWRQHRAGLAGVAALLGGLSVYLWLTGLRMHHAWSLVAACHPAASIACQNLISDFNQQYQTTAETVAALMQALPALIGAFVGAPVLARELETGTFRYAWTQGFGRWRWTLAKLVSLAIIVTAAAGAFSVLFSWYYQPFFDAGQQTPLAPTVFTTRGIAFAAWTLAAFAIGALAGMLIRRVVPAIAATLVGYAALAFATGMFLRQHYLAPLAAVTPNLPSSAWIIGHWYTKAGQPASMSVVDHLIAQDRNPPAVRVGPNSFEQILDPGKYLAQHGIESWMSWQPASRFWPFQWIEGGWLLALSVLLIAATVWLVRRRAA
jgi:hypothetical protein